ncbi:MULTISPECIES: KAP family NTPase [unclassified Pantoea]|uniref:KAP family NTPase n=1 Tax=unclassified Pantoea TaxID=2630326 RepID=UPI00211816C3|nr:MULTISPECIES: KAP family NTPase [unclassified Pantoea]
MEDLTTQNVLSSYIDYYSSINSPGYAVLVTGAWGVGKTFQVKKALNDKMVYVSLFGLTSTAEIFSAVYAKSYPRKALTKKFLSWFKGSSVKTGAVTVASGDLIGNVGNAIFSEKVDTSKIIVFDDLERCSINLNNVLGCINKYVEHHKCHVIVIAHDGKINKTIKNKKEKIFGQTINIVPETDEAYKSFISENKIRITINEIAGIILSSYKASECQSLRVLKHALNDCTRLFSLLEEKHINNKTFLNELFTFYSAISINVREGEISPTDLYLREEIAWLAGIKKDEDTKSPLIKIRDTYYKNRCSILINTKTISNQDLIDSLIHGRFNKKSIIETINLSRHFIKEQTSEPWRIIINFETNSNQETNKAIENIFSDLDNLKIIDPGSILHTFNILLMLSRIHHIPLNYGQIEKLAFNYFKKLQSNNIFPVLKSPHDTRQPHNDHSQGYGYWTHEDYHKESTSIQNGLDKNLSISFKKKYPSFIKEILEALNTDSVKFKDIISYNRGNPGKFFFVDVLAYIKPYIFVDKWLSLDNVDQQIVRDALYSRFNSGHLDSHLSAEKKWVDDVVMNLAHRASKLSGLDRFRITRLVIKG